MYEGKPTPYQTTNMEEYLLLNEFNIMNIHFLKFISITNPAPGANGKVDRLLYILQKSVSG